MLFTRIRKSKKRKSMLKSNHLVQFCYDDRRAVRVDQNKANTLKKLKGKHWKWTAMGHRFAKMSNAFDGASQFEFLTELIECAYKCGYVCMWDKEKENQYRYGKYQINKAEHVWFGRQIWQSKNKQTNKRTNCIQLPVSILPDHLWTVIAIDPENWCHCQLLVVYPNCMPYLRNDEPIPNEMVTKSIPFLSIEFLANYLFRCSHMEYLLANEWATSASNSRLFRIFLPLERSGTLTESIVLQCVRCQRCVFFLVVISSYQKRMMVFSTQFRN